MILGGTPATEKETKRPIILAPSFSAISRLASKMQDAPSVIWEEFPAVVVPSLRKTGLSFPRVYMVV